MARLVLLRVGTGAVAVPVRTRIRGVVGVGRLLPAALIRRRSRLLRREFGAPAARGGHVLLRGCTLVGCLQLGGILQPFGFGGAFEATDERLDSSVGPAAGR